MVTVLGILPGLAALIVVAIGSGGWLQSHEGLVLQWTQPTAAQAWLVGALLAAGCCASLLPGWRTYRPSLADRLAPRA